MTLPLSETVQTSFFFAPVSKTTAG